MKILFGLLFLGLVLSSAQSTASANKKLKAAIPDIKASVEFELIRTLKELFLIPLANNFLSNLTIPGPVNLEQKIGLATLYLNASKIHLDSYTIDWANTNLLAAPENRIQLMISNVSLGISLDYNIKYVLDLFSGRGTVAVKDLFATILLEIKEDTSVESGFLVFINNTQVWWDSISINFNTVLNAVVNEYVYLQKTSIQQQIDTAINTQLNATLVGLSSKPIVLNATLPNGKIYQARFAATKAPSVDKVVDNTTTYNYLNIPVDVILKNVQTNETAPIRESDNMPPRVMNASDIELLVSNNIVNQLVWVLLDSGLLNVTISNKNLNSSSLPIQLNTSAINILFPGIYDFYGPNKGIYIQVASSSSFSHVYVRGGRFIGEISLSLRFFVDKDSSDYPNQGLQNCSACEEALNLNTTIFFGAHAYMIDNSTFGINVIDLKFYDMHLINSRVYVNMPLTSTMLNSLGGAMIPSINDALKAGIKNTFLGAFGINKMEFLLAVDYFYAGLGFAPLKQNKTANSTRMVEY